MASALQGRLVQPRTPEFGGAFETWFLHELIAFRDYVSAETVSHWRSSSGLEVDFIIGDHTAIEVKAKHTVSGADLRSLRALAEEKLLKRYVCVSLEPRARHVDGVSVLPWRECLEALWSGQFTS